MSARDHGKKSHKSDSFSGVIHERCLKLFVMLFVITILDVSLKEVYYY